MKYITIPTIIMTVFLSIAPWAQAINNPPLLVLEPTVSAVTATSATFSISNGIKDLLSTEQEAALYFEYSETQRVCIMIYPTPENCLPKKTPKGQLSATVSGLKPSTSYTVRYKTDNTINCITTPCPSNGIESGAVEFTTASSTQASGFYRNLRVGTRGSDVILLQDILRSKGYLSVVSTGYFGIVTLKAVKDFQRNDMRIPPTGFVGPLTRAALTTASTDSDARFEGTIQAVSTACFADGICSITIDGKVVVTTIGWSQATVGSIKGSVSSIGDAEGKIGRRASVYAKKTADGYTLYGNSAYYIDIK